MIRFCPNCNTERPLHEIFCEGEVNGRFCGWDLAGEAIRPEGWRPQTIVTREELAAVPAASPDEQTFAPLVCENGHPLDPGDLMCAECGAVPACAGPGDVPAGNETVIDGWRLLKQISNTDNVRERYQAEHVESGRVAILTLYHAGAEPDPTVYDVVRRLPREHVPEILSTGRWNERAYELAEELTGGTLSDIGIVIHDMKAVRHVVRELGRALHAFSEAGLRHRDLRPGTLLVRSREPLDLVISGFGSACLSEFDLDIVAPLETGVYTAPEILSGGVAAASDWWSLGMVLLEQMSGGACFSGIGLQTFLIHVLANGVLIPEEFDPRLAQLLRGLLTRNHRERWQWREVEAWLDGRPIDAPVSSSYPEPETFALVTGTEANQWPSEHEGVDDDFRLMLAVSTLNPRMPLIQRGEIVTPGWLMAHPLEGYRLIDGLVPDLLEQRQPGHWLARLKLRAKNVRQRAASLDIELNEDSLRVYLLCTSHAQLEAQWRERQSLLPDTAHTGILALSDRRAMTEEDLIVLLAAEAGQFDTRAAVLAEAARLAREAGVGAFEFETATVLLRSSRQTLYRLVDERIGGFAVCFLPRVDAWAERFRLERRMPLAWALVLLLVPVGQWRVPEKRQYVIDVIRFFGKKIAASSLRGPLARMRIGKHSARIDLCEFDTARRPAAKLLSYLVGRHLDALALDPIPFRKNPLLEPRFNMLYRQNDLYKRDTGIDGLYLGFPFLLVSAGTRRPRLVPLLLWPAKLGPRLGGTGNIYLGFDGERGEVRVNPALETLLGTEAAKRWHAMTNELLGRPVLSPEDVLDACAEWTPIHSRVMTPYVSVDLDGAKAPESLVAMAVLFHVSFIAQAIGEDLRQLQMCSPTGTGLETMIRLDRPVERVEEDAALREPGGDFFMAASDPSQEDAVFRTRQAPGLLIEGPPGTGKSQTIVNIVADAIGRHKTLLIVCQKYAALRVVQNRLLAEGLQDRIVMIGDPNSDRGPVIRSIRTQVENLFRQKAGMSAPDLASKRKRTIERIETLERELDRFHRALHEVDARCGLSYRQLLGELIELQESSPPSFPTLRPWLANFDMPGLARIKEHVAPLAALWLSARYEDSPFAGLAAFAVDKKSIAAFTNSLDRFRAAEQDREKVLRKYPAYPAGFESEDPEHCRHWLRSAKTLADLSEAEYQRLLRWFPLFRSPAEGAGVLGEKLLADLQKLKSRLERLETWHYSSAFSPSLDSLDDDRLADLMKSARHVIEVLDDSFFTQVEPHTNWRRLWRTCAGFARFFTRADPAFRWRYRKLRAFLAAHGDSGDARLPELLAAIELETAWRHCRAALAAIRRPLGLPEVHEERGFGLAVLVETDMRELGTVQARLKIVLNAPALWAGKAESAILSGRQEAWEKLLRDVDAVIIHHGARQASFASLSVLSPWLGETLRDAFHAAISNGREPLLRLDALQSALPHLAAYQRFRARAATLEKPDLECFARLRNYEAELEAIDKNQLEASLGRALDCDARLGWKYRIERERPELLFSQEELRAKVGALAEADREMRALNRELLRYDLSPDLLGNRKDWEDITRLAGARALRLREFISGGAERGLMRLRPVWLMNPDAASRVLPLQPGLFDIVVYDEASQMPVEFAVPTLYRARLAVVSGDEKQMPPTHFFGSRTEDDETEASEAGLSEESMSEEFLDEVAGEHWNQREIKDCPDLLHLAKAVLPVATLQIHYRSTYRELISFSNAAFYEGRLHVPARYPETEILRVQPLEFIQVDGLYQNQTNAVEARHIVEYLAKLWRETKQEERPSVGIVTFNRKQADLIEEYIEGRTETDVAFHDAYIRESTRVEGGEDRSIFVKNVENVQGDERDLILFSTTFGRNSQGVFRRNFGALGQKGGERRLNVAITRARRKIVMMTSMPVADISDFLNTRRAPTIPRDYLQACLEYMRVLSAGDFAAGHRLLNRLQTRAKTETLSGLPKTAFGDGFNGIVARYIASLGLKAMPVDESDAFGLDFAIESPVTGLYAIGIECDAHRHPLLAHARAREIWRPSVLGRAIPFVHRISSQGWLHDGEKERRRLREAIEQALAAVATRAGKH